VIDKHSTLEDVCFAVAAALEAASLDAVLTGGSAATMYAAGAYNSFDADFVLRRDVQGTKLTEILATLGFRPAATRGMFEHPTSRFTIDFPKGPLAVGGDYVQNVATLERGESHLRILTLTDCVKDRLAHFFFWNDLTALRAAVAVAKSHRDSGLDCEELQRWTTVESGRGGMNFQPKLDRFFKSAGLNGLGRPGDG
jgi:hypothetical protein